MIFLCELTKQPNIYGKIILHGRRLEVRMMNVGEVLKIPILEKCHVIGGEVGKNREVLYVNMMDAPDIIHYLKPNVLLVTTGYHIKDNIEFLIELIRSMEKKGCAALGIKTKRFLKEIPDEIRDLADELAFPIIDIPMDLSLGDIVNHTLSYILDKRTNELQQAINVHKQFTNHIMSGRGVEKLIDNLSEILGLPVSLLDQYAKCICCSPRGTGISTETSSLFPINQLRLKAISNSSVTFSLINNKQTYSIFPFRTYEKKIGYLAVIGEIHLNDHSAYLTIEQAANVISFEWMKENALKQNYERIKNDFFFHFVEGSTYSQEEIINRAAEFSLQRDQRYVCAAGMLDTPDFSGTYTQTLLKNDAIFDYIEEELMSLSVDAHLFKKGDHCVLLFERSEKERDSNVFLVLKQIQASVNKHFNQSISFGVSNLAVNFLYVKNAFKEAMDTLKTNSLSGKKFFIEGYRTKDISELLRVIPTQDLKDFYLNALNKLSSPKYDEDETLLKTLFVYVETHCQISETAKRLFVHRNTVVYRLEKCQELLEKDISDPETTLQIRLAMHIKAMLQL